MPSTIVPKALEPGATIAFVSPSARLNDRLPAVMARATAVLTGRGYQVKEFYAPDTDIASNLANRLSELRAAFLDPTISAIICTIGGTTFTELLPSLIADSELHAAIRAHPKVVVGYSDITGLHWFLYACTGLRTFYGPGAIPELGAVGPMDDEETEVAFTVRNLFRAVADRAPIGDVARSPIYAPRAADFFKDPASTKSLTLAPTTGWKWIRPGRAQGRLFGGCISVMARLHGVQGIVPDWRGRIVFFESATGEDIDSGPPLPRVRASIADLIAQGVFKEAAGLVVGRPYGYDTPEEKEQYIGLIKGLLCEGPAASHQFPILFDVDIGHTTPMVTLPFDALAVLDSEKDQFAILESGVL